MLNDLEEQKERLARLKVECEQLQSSAVGTVTLSANWHLSSLQAPLEKLQKNHGFLVSDRAKFQDVLQRFESRKKHLIDTIAHEKAELTVRSKSLIILVSPPGYYFLSSFKLGAP